MQSEAGAAEIGAQAESAGSEAESVTDLWAFPGQWASSPRLPAPAGRALKVEIEASGNGATKVELQLLRRASTGAEAPFAWAGLHQGPLLHERWLIDLSELTVINDFEPSGDDYIFVRAKGIDAESCRLRLSKFEVLGLEGPDASAEALETEPPSKPAAPIDWTRPPVTPKSVERALAGHRRAISDWGDAKVQLSRRSFFDGEPVEFDFEVVRLEGDGFSQFEAEQASMRVHGWSSWGAPTVELSFVAEDVLRGHATVRDFVAGKAMQNVHGPGEHHSSQTFDVILILGERLVFCGQILVVRMPRPEHFVLNLGCQDDLSTDWIGLDARPFRRGEIESVMWDFATGLAFAEDGTVDGVTVSHALMYLTVPTVRRFMREAYRALKPEGVLRVTEDDARVHIADECHYTRLYTDPATISALMREAGFEPAVVDPDTSFAVVPGVKRKLHMKAWDEQAWRAGQPSKIFFVEGLKPRRHYAVGTTRIRDPLKGLQAENIIDHKQFALLPNASFHDLGDGYSHFTADPFLFRKDGRFYLFYEARTTPACIAVAESAEGLNWGQARICMRPPTHRSFPFVFEREGEAYMIPESGADRNVVLYRATAFPDEWTPVRTLLEGRKYADCSVLRHDGIDYLFAWADQQLMVFWTPDLVRGELRPHPENPVCTGPRLSRPAGKPFVSAGRVYRPAQDGVRHYGESVHLLEIVELTPDRYAEVLYREGFLAGDMAQGAMTWKAKIHHYDLLQLGEGEWLCAFDGTALLK